MSFHFLYAHTCRMPPHKTAIRLALEGLETSTPPVGVNACREASTWDMPQAGGVLSVLARHSLTLALFMDWTLVVMSGSTRKQCFLARRAPPSQHVHPQSHRYEAPPSSGVEPVPWKEVVGSCAFVRE
eukprot:scaffold544_cov320-Pavlova_lutheri.AAC.40